MDVRISNVEEIGNALLCFIRYIFTTECLFTKNSTQLELNATMHTNIFFTDNLNRSSLYFIINDVETFSQTFFMK